MSNHRDTDVHSCHDGCPCRTGGEPMGDFLAVEGMLPLLMPAILRAWGEDPKAIPAMCEQLFSRDQKPE